MDNLVSSIICSEFDDILKFRHQMKYNSKTKKYEYGKYMKITFRLFIDYDKEDGYRNLDIYIYGESNYVKVFSEERWDVISTEDIDYENDCLKKGKEYTKGSSGIQFHSDHDSCWRSDGIERVISKYRDRIVHLDSIFGWYELEDMTEDFLKQINKARDERYK